MFKGLLSQMLPAEYINQHIELTQDENLIYLTHNGKVVNFYNSSKVSDSEVKQDATKLYIQLTTGNKVSFAYIPKTRNK